MKNLSLCHLLVVAVLFSLWPNVSPASGQNRVASIEKRKAYLRKKYQSLYQLPVTTEADGSKRFHEGRLYLREGVRLLHLKGEPFEMAFQHGKLLASEIPEGVIAIASKMLQNQVRNKLGDKPVMVGIVTKFLHDFVTEKIFKATLNSGEEASAQRGFDEAIGLSESSGIPTDTLIRALFTPEALMILAHTSVDSKGVPALPPPTGNCSAFVAWDTYTPDAEILIGRNTDYGVTGYFDRFPTVIYFEPTGAKHRYMTMVTAGLHNAGLVSYNDAGIFVSAHTIPSSDVSKEGIPAFMIVNEVIRNATTLSEVVQAFKTFHPPTGWAYTVVSHTEKRAATVEISNGHMAVRESTGGLHVQSNLYHTAEMLPHYKFINRSVDIDAAARYSRLKSLAEDAHGDLTLERAAHMLGDMTDPFTGAPRSVPNTVAVHTNISSMLVHPASGKLYFGNGRAPVSQSSFVEVPLITHLTTDALTTQNYRTLHNQSTATQFPTASSALQEFLRAKMAYEYEMDMVSAVAHLRKASALEPNNPVHSFLVGVLEARLGHHSAALKAFTTSLASASAAEKHRQHLAAYYAGRVLADRPSSASEKNRALEYFSGILADKSADRKLVLATREAHDALRQKGSVRLTDDSLGLMFQQADLLNY